MDNHETPTVKESWRSSKWFILSTIAIALFGETFLYGFLVPILGYMIQNRLRIDPSQTQTLTSTVLALHGAVAMLSGPIIGHYADRTPNYKTALLSSLGFCIIGTFMVAAARSAAILLLGRVIQGIAGSAVWIVGFATVANTVSSDNMGSAMGLMMSLANTGTVSGPAVSGLLLEATNYWVTWSVPLIVLTIDLVARMAMIESPTPSKKTEEPSDSTALLSHCQDQNVPDRASHFWRIVLCDSSALTCLLITLNSALVTASFHATLPLHIEELFNWGSSTSGLLFAGLVVPGLVLGPVAGWTCDRIGAQIPVTVGCIVQAALLGLMGIAGTDMFYWASVETGGKAIYIASIIGIGIARPFVSGIAPIEMTAAVKSLQERTPGIFGSNGGLSRIFAMLDVAVCFGTMVGPIIGGTLKSLVGYKNLSWTLGFFYIGLAILAASFSKRRDTPGPPRPDDA